MTQQELSKRAQRIRTLALDFDGTLTDGYVDFGEDGYERVRCSRKDSLGTNMLQAVGIHVVVISKEANRVVTARCKKMRIDCYQAVDTVEDKLVIFKRYLEERGVAQEEAAYMGDDINDILCIEFAGLGVTVADGHERCKEAADYITARDGGKHAVREVCDLILKAREESHGASG